MSQEKLKEILIAAGNKGLRVDMNAFLKEETLLMGARQVAQCRLDEEAGRPIIAHSTKDVAKLLYEERGNTAFYTKTGRVSTSIEALISCPDPIVKLLTDVKKVSAILKYFTIARKFLRSDEAGTYIPYQFVVDSCVTGRIYAKEPSVMSFPVPLRRCIIPTPGNVFVHADYDREELCILAHYVGDTEFLKDIRDGVDIFQELANLFDPDKREETKMVIYAFFYGASKEGLARKLNVPVDVVVGVIDALNVRYPLLATAPAKITAQVKQVGYAETLLEKNRYAINTENPDQDEEYRRACNFVPQGTAAEVLRRLIVRLDQEGMIFKMSTHDSVLLELPAENVELAFPKLQAIMSKDLPGALFAKVGKGKNWAEASGEVEIIEEEV